MPILALPVAKALAAPTLNLRGEDALTATTKPGITKKGVNAGPYLHNGGGLIKSESHE